MEGRPLKRRTISPMLIWIGIMILIFLFPQIMSVFSPPAKEIAYSAFKTALTDGKISTVLVSDTAINGKMADGTAFTTVRVTDPDLTQLMEAKNVEIRGQTPSTNGGFLGIILVWVLPLALMAGLWFFLLRRSSAGGARGGGMNNIFSFGKSKARVITGEQTGVTFKDVGGAGEAITDLKEVTEFLKNPEHFQRLGGKMPKGVLLVGPPGTGKTLLARATAGEAGVQFFNLSGAEFVEMFVGVGASRVRDLFNQAKKGAPSIIFIDEIDAIGGDRKSVV